MITLPHGTSERPAKAWSTMQAEDFIETVVNLAASRNSGNAGPTVIAVDGRGGSGKTTFATALTSALRTDGREAVLVATDDLAWHAPLFGWTQEALEMVLKPIRLGAAVDYAPAAWKEKGRQGSIRVPSSTEFVVVEGVGASQRAFEDLVDVSLWFQSDWVAAREIGIARDLESGVNGDAEETAAFWDEWQAHELPFLEEEEPWRRADFVVAGTGLRVPQNAVVSVATPA